MLDNEELERELKKIHVKIIYYTATILIKCIEVSYKTYMFVEDNIINKIKNADAFSKINVGEVWREYEDLYTTTTYTDWIVLNKSQELITVSSIKEHSDFSVKVIEPRIMAELWLKK